MTTRQTIIAVTAACACVGVDVAIAASIDYSRIAPTQFVGEVELTNALKLVGDVTITTNDIAISAGNVTNRYAYADVARVITKQVYSNRIDVWGWGLTNASRKASNEKIVEQTLPPVSGTRGTPAAYAPAAPGIPER